MVALSTLRRAELLELAKEHGLEPGEGAKVVELREMLKPLVSRKRRETEGAGPSGSVQTGSAMGSSVQAPPPPPPPPPRPSPAPKKRKYRVCDPETAKRLDRAFTHRLYLLECSGYVPGVSAGFDVMGTTGNVYRVDVQRKPCCNCPDHQRRKTTCKHMLFVMVRVLKRDDGDPLIWQRTLKNDELASMLSVENLPSLVQGAGDVLAEERVRAAYAQMHAPPPPEETLPAGQLRPGQRSLEGDCPICFEALADDNGVPGEAVVFCKAKCGNNVHSECFARWEESKKRRGERVTCPFCRETWAGLATGVASPTKYGYGNYVNLSQQGI